MACKRRGQGSCLFLFSGWGSRCHVTLQAQASHPLSECVAASASRGMDSPAPCTKPPEASGQRAPHASRPGSLSGRWPRRSTRVRSPPRQELTWSSCTPAVVRYNCRLASTLGNHNTRVDNAQAPGWVRVGHKNSRSGVGGAATHFAIARSEGVRNQIWLRTVLAKTPMWE